ncbi:LysR family transcriptional regulator [Granulosicoccus antarcticus]|uniref:HTH-type transcriptional activator AllS n=1 Tax=Granulosicoccus antarcticus IMCC3135 TaxID=1192854 RepID=A0A2Z2NUG8_9GAMM|nr:LysR family transcriptional regulator [Granulosicoccus antarcticus]ASJ74145.1 HTH-type transcriptional activator AllS [Granulosicoccus antarcticus IMCC3135]
MIDSYRGLAVFVAVADTGSLSAAGRRLKLSTSVVSHHLSRLEAQKMGTALFFRSTHSMSLTAEGQTALSPARRMVAAGEEAIDALTAVGDDPVGTLHITMPAWGGRARLRQKLWSFARLYPAVKTFEDLAACDYIAMSSLPNTDTFVCDGVSVPFKPENIRLEVGTIGSAKSALLAGLGFRLLPFDEIEEEVASGSLVQLLPEWGVPDMGVYAVWPNIDPEKALTRRLIDFFLDD